MSRERFLLYLLAAVFAVQTALFGAGFYFCTKNGGLKVCPQIGERYDQTFNVMIATTLALLTGQAIKE